MVMFLKKKKKNTTWTSVCLLDSSLSTTILDNCICLHKGIYTLYFILESRSSCFLASKFLASMAKRD